MGIGKNKWKLSFSLYSSMLLKSDKIQPPKEFICPISGSLMADPVIVCSGQTLERNCVQICQNLGFTPILPDGIKPDFSTVIPNMAIKSTILTWCDTHGVEHPKPPNICVTEKLIHTLMASQEDKSEENKNGEKKIAKSEDESLKKVISDESGVSYRPSHFYYSSSEESVTMTPLPLATPPSCFSSSSSSSFSSDVVSYENLNPNSSEEEEEIFVKLKSSQVFEQEEAVILLRKITRTREETRVSLCTPRLLSALRSLLLSHYSTIQINSVASVVNLSLEKVNKVKIVRLGIVPRLINVLKGGFPESQEHAAGAIFSLALDDGNKTAIGVLGALSPLLHMLRSESERTRHDSALALYHLSLVQSNRSKLVKLGSVPMLLGMAKSGDLSSRVLLILCNLAASSEGRAVMLEANGVECFVGLLRRNELISEATRDNCVTGLYLLSQGSLRFKGLAKAAGLVEVLREVEEKGSEKAREEAKRLMKIMRGRDGREVGNELEWLGE